MQRCRSSRFSSVAVGAVLLAAPTTVASLDSAQRPRRAMPCDSAIARGVICEPAAQFAGSSMRHDDLVAAIVVQDVGTGSLVVSMASRPDTLDIRTPVHPLSFMKVLLAASWFEHGLHERRFDCIRDNGRRHTEVSIDEMLVNGCDLPGKQMAGDLARKVGRAPMLADLERFVASPVALTADVGDTEWGDTWSIGEKNAFVTLPALSRFLQAVGNHGIVVDPSSRTRARLLKTQTTERIIAAMRDAVRRGTAKGSDADLQGTSWTIGGKTGSAAFDPGEPLDGLFGGLIFGPDGRARFTVVTYVRHGGFGGGAAARLSARVARYLAGF